mgnify:CR=1 FL=1
MTKSNYVLRRIILGAFAVMILAVVAITVLYITHSPPLFNDMKQVLAKQFDKTSYQALNIKYAYGDMISREAPSGDVVGRIDNEKARQALLSTQPFIDCPHGCKSWISRSSLPTSLDLYEKQTGSGPPKADVMHLHATATQPDARCVVRYHHQNQTLNSRYITVFCFSPKTGAFAYHANA